MSVQELIDQVVKDYLSLSVEERIERSRDISYFFQSIQKIVTVEESSPLRMEVEIDEGYDSI
jgi:hypothetical protein